MRQKSSNKASVVKVTASNFMADKHKKSANTFFFFTKSLEILNANSVQILRGAEVIPVSTSSDHDFSVRARIRSYPRKSRTTVADVRFGSKTMCSGIMMATCNSTY